ncbi:efflux RND transporter periplasmic adaptor subunit [Pectobacterium carotovorum]|uniref:efflux RND transporter periplasmic adaptor subunit n=1 Tax=Pectobacterium carotovorum TaxID=554 RepID=UPI003017E14D
MQCFQLVIIGLLGSLLVIVAGCDQKKVDSAVAVQPVRVHAIQVSLTEYQPVIEVTGEVKAKVQTEISFRVAGKVTERRVNVGTRVKTGDILARLDDKEQRSDLDNAKATLKSALASLLQKTRTYNRYKTLLPSRVVAKAEYDQALEDMNSAKNIVAAAKANLAIAQENLSYTELKADADGVITTRSFEVGQVVSAAQPVLTLAHGQERDAVFNVFEAYFLKGEPLKTVTVHPVGNAEEKITGKIREISPVIDPATGTIRVKVSLPTDSPWSLGSPLTGELSQYTQNKISLPWRAMDSNNGVPSVWVINTINHEVSMRKIFVERYRSEDFIVTDGLKPEEWVVVDGGRFLREGQKVFWNEK